MFFALLGIIFVDEIKTAISIGNSINLLLIIVYEI
jgi:hypothetical protein